MHGERRLRPEPPLAAASCGSHARSVCQAQDGSACGVVWRGPLWNGDTGSKRGCRPGSKLFSRLVTRRSSTGIPRGASTVGCSVVAILLALGLTACGGANTKKATSAPAAGVSAGQLAALGNTVGHPVYWAGPVASDTYELSQTKDGRIYIRYLPQGVNVGDSRPNFLTVGTYPQSNAYATLKATARAQGVATVTVTGGGLAFQDKKHPTSVYLAYPGSRYQIEVYDPSGDRARQLVVAGKIAPLAAADAASTGATALSPTQIKSLASQLHQRIYWAGAQANRTYELTRTTDGRIYIRYLPTGVHVGDQRPNYLTVGTYPQKGALAFLKTAAAKSKAETIKLSGGGLASIDKARPTSVYVAYPGSDIEIEVYDPMPSQARQLVRSGQIAPVG